MLKNITTVLLVGGMALVMMHLARAEPQHNQHPDMQRQHQSDGTPAQDTRTLVDYPEMMRIHTLSNMRDHLLALGEIQAALADDRFDQAGEIAEQRLGMSSLDDHGAHEVSEFMPQKMQEMGTAMHRAASRFAVVANDAAVEGDIRRPLAALSRLTQSCVACHASYRLQ